MEEKEKNGWQAPLVMADLVAAMGIMFAIYVLFGFLQLENFGVFIAPLFVIIYCVGKYFSSKNNKKKEENNGAV